MPSGPKGRRCDGCMGGKSRALPWEVCSSAEGLATLRGVVKAEQKSAEAVVAAAHRGEGPNERSRVGSKRSMSEKDAAQKAEKPERSRKVGGGTAEGTTPARQALTARGEEAKAEAPSLIEEVLRRENVRPAYKRVVPTRYLRAHGLLSFLAEHRRLACSS